MSISISYIKYRIRLARLSYRIISPASMAAGGDTCISTRSHMHSNPHGTNGKSCFYESEKDKLLTNLIFRRSTVWALWKRSLIKSRNIEKTRKTWFRLNIEINRNNYENFLNWTEVANDGIYDMGTKNAKIETVALYQVIWYFCFIPPSHKQVKCDLICFTGTSTNPTYTTHDYATLGNLPRNAKMWRNTLIALDKLCDFRTTEHTIHTHTFLAHIYIRN